MFVRRIAQHRKRLVKMGVNCQPVVIKQDKDSCQATSE